MAVRRKPDGTYEFDTVAEAVEFERLSAKNGQKADHSRRILPTVRHAAKDVQGFVGSLADNQRAIVNALKVGELVGDDLARKAHIDVGAIGPTLRHIRDLGGKFGLDQEQIVVREKRKDEHGKPTVSAYKLGKELEGIT